MTTSEGTVTIIEGTPQEELVVAVFVGPRHGEKEEKKGIVCKRKGLHEQVDGYGKICYHRLDRAGARALLLGTRLMICGDAARGADVKRLTARAIAQGLPEDRIIPLTCMEEDGSNTHLDAQGAAWALKEDPRLVKVKRMVVVTCHYHMERAVAELFRAFREALGEGRRIILETLRVYGVRVSEDVRLAEAQGVRDCRAGRPHKSDSRGVVGKPVLDETPPPESFFTPSVMAHQAVEQE